MIFGSALIVSLFYTFSNKSHFRKEKYLILRLVSNLVAQLHNSTSKTIETSK